MLARQHRRCVLSYQLPSNACNEAPICDINNYVYLRISATKICYLRFALNIEAGSGFQVRKGRKFLCYPLFEINKKSKHRTLLSLAKTYYVGNWLTVTLRRIKMARTKTFILYFRFPMRHNKINGIIF